MKSVYALLAAITLAVVPTAAFAKTVTTQNVAACASEIRAQLPVDASDLDVDFKRVKGNSRLQTLTFNVEAEGERGKATCKVRRNEAPVLSWDADFEAYKTELVKRKSAKPAAGETI